MTPELWPEFGVMLVGTLQPERADLKGYLDQFSSEVSLR
jgi:hypothetical protein